MEQVHSLFVVTNLSLWDRLKMVFKPRPLEVRFNFGYDGKVVKIDSVIAKFM